MQIFKWVGGSFFRTLGRFLFYIAIGLLFGLIATKLDIDFSKILMEDAYAIEFNSDYISNYNVPVRSSIQYSTNPYTQFDLSVGLMGDLLLNSSTPNLANRSYQYATSVAWANNREIWIQTHIGQTKAGNLYNYQLLVCSNKSPFGTSYSSRVDFGLSQWQQFYYPAMTYESHIRVTVGDELSPYFASSSNINYCWSFMGYSVPTVTTTTLSVHAVGTSSLTGVNLYIMGFNITDLGYYEGNLLNDIEDIIETNMDGVATKSDIQSVQRQIEATNEAISDVNDTISDSNTTGANSDASGFFDNFQSNDHGLTGIITTPLNLINSITSSTCQPLTLPLPFVNENLTLPCMTSIYSQYFGTFFTIYQTVTFGIVAYWVCVRVFYKVQDFKNPSNSEVEVLEL